MRMMAVIQVRCLPLFKAILTTITIGNCIPIPTMSIDEYVSSANQYLGKFGWGAQGRMLGLSRMFQDNDVNMIKKGKYVVSFRPRGVLSGFLVILPSTQMTFYIPPIAGRMCARQLRLRVSNSLLQDGAILSCYWDTNELVLEDILVWKGQPIWQTISFEERWNTYMKRFCTEWRPDPVLQDCKIRLAEYISLDQFQTLAENDVVEFVPQTPNTKRLIWLPTMESSEDAMTMWACRESSIGPDIFSLWKSKNIERQGLAYIKSLATSRALRLHKESEFHVKTVWNRRFERYEIVDIASP